MAIAKFAPTYKVIHPNGEYIAATKYPVDAAVLVAAYGKGARVKARDRIVWHEGKESFPAGESYDRVATVIIRREMERNQRDHDRQMARHRERVTEITSVTMTTEGTLQ